MSRARSNEVIKVNGRYRVQTPAAIGSKKSVRRTFTTKVAATDYLAACEQALAAGEALPDAAAFEVSRSAGGWHRVTASTVSPASKPTPVPAPLALPNPLAGGWAEILATADAWVDHRYVKFGKPGSTRGQDVASDLRLHVLPALQAAGVTGVADVDLPRMDEVVLLLAQPPAAVSVLSSPYAGAAPITLVDAVKQGWSSHSTLKRRLAEDRFAQSAKDDDGTWWLLPSDLAADGLSPSIALKRGPRTEAPAQGTLDDRRWMLEKMLEFGKSHRRWPLNFDPIQIAHPTTLRPRKPKAQVVTMAACWEMAQHLHAVHQVVLWFIRILGLRIAEAFGIRIRDYRRLGAWGVISIAGQGGRKFADPNQIQPVKAAAQNESTGKSRIDRVKTKRSERVVAVPPALADLIDLVITIFHTGNDGVIDPDAQLIPVIGSLTGGVASFTSALRAAARTTQQAVLAATETDEQVHESLLDPDLASLQQHIHAHLMRKASNTELHDAGVGKDLVLQFLGHGLGDDVNSVVYRIDHPDMQRLLPLVDALQDMIVTGVPQGLIVPTLKRCTTGSQTALEPRAEIIDAALRDHGWLIVPTAHGTVLLTPEECAFVLKRGVTTVRRWMNKGLLPSSVTAVHGRGRTLGAALADVEALKSRLDRRIDFATLAREWDWGYDEVLDAARRCGVSTDKSDAFDGLPADQVGLLRAERARIDALVERSVPLTEAIEFLQIMPSIAEAYLADQRLVLDAERGLQNRRYVTRASLNVVAGTQNWRRKIG